ncbi:MAG TPA: ferritin-like domain-containing protein [Polyangiales bacterium]|nr:ferritin-like domain-containing protein [Polyangiales bacterium]
MNLLGGSLKLAREPDYLALYYPYLVPDVGQTWKPLFPAAPYGEWGEVCASAGDVDACQAALKELLVVGDACDAKDKCRPFGVTTDGDEAQRFADRDALLEVLGRIDTQREAVALASFDGRLEIRCAGRDDELAPLLRGTEVKRVEDGFLVQTSWENCGVQKQLDSVHVHADGSASDEKTVKLGDSNCVVGRRPFGLCARELHAHAAPLAAFFADAARLEAASVFAFELLARELSQFGAPVGLIVQALQSAQDEVRHAQLVAGLARRYGAEPEQAKVVRAPMRPLFAVALDNAVEGCVRETFGALVGAHQAALARDPEVAAIMRGIAADEARHANLAWQVADFLEPQLSAAERDALAAAKRAAVESLIAEASEPVLPPSAARAAGWPEPAVARALALRMADALRLRETALA